MKNKKDFVFYAVLGAFIASMIIGLACVETSVQKRWDAYEQSVFVERGIK